MAYEVLLSSKVEKRLRKLDKPTERLVLAWIHKNLEDCENPREKGQPLNGSHNKLWRYRIGDYRLIADIEDDVSITFLLDLGHRRDIY